jgi:hypothetical protein
MVLATKVDQCFFITDPTTTTHIVVRREEGASSEWMELPTMKTLTSAATQNMTVTMMKHTPKKQDHATEVRSSVHQKKSKYFGAKLFNHDKEGKEDCETCVVNLILSLAKLAKPSSSFESR